MAKFEGFARVVPIIGRFASKLDSFAAESAGPPIGSGA